MDFVTLFGKLPKHKMKLKRLADDEESNNKKNKSFALKVKNVIDMDS